MVLHPDKVTNRYSHFTTFKKNSSSTFCKEQTACSSQQAQFASFQDIRKKPGATNLSADNIGMIQQSRHPSTTKRYDHNFGKWKVFCFKVVMITFQHLQIRPLNSLPKSLNLVGVGYSSVGAARSALSCAFIIDNRISFGKHPLVQQFMKDI